MEQLIVLIAAAVNMWTLYPSHHPRVVQAIEQIIAALNRILSEEQTDSVTFLLVGDDLVVGQDVLRKTTLSHQQFVSVLQRRGFERLTLAAGIENEEAGKFIAALATGEGVESSPHVIFGRVQINIDDDAMKKTEDRHELTTENFEQVRQAFARFRTDQKIPLGAMEQLVWGFVDSLSRTTRSVLPLAKLKEHDEYTFIHSVNVSLLVLAQARSFGIQGAMLHSFGMAALLHDIGKLMVPLDVLNKPGKLEGEQWVQMQSHAEEGAWYLGDTAGSPPMSILVAYEHHLRYDGQPAYPILKKPRIPNLVSRMTSIADAYDAMSTVRPYQKPLMRSAALEILKKRAETFYDPMLVTNFIQIVETNT